MKNIFTEPIPEIAITITIAIIGSLTWLLVFKNHYIANFGSISGTFNSILETPLLIFAFCIWLKALYIDYMRIRSNQKAKLPLSVYFFAFVELCTVYTLVFLFPNQTDIQWWFGIVWIIVNIFFFTFLPKLKIKRPPEFIELAPFEENLFKAYVVTSTVFLIFAFVLPFRGY